MKISNRLFPYPVLCGNTDDYTDTTEFALETQFNETMHELRLSYDFVVRCAALEDLLRDGKASYVIHVECSETAFRTALKSDVPYIEYKIPKSKVSGEVTIIAMIVAKQQINNYICDDLNEDYKGEIISFPKGAILAYQNLPPIHVKKQIEELAKSNAFFTVVKQLSADPDEIKPVTFNLASSKIQILVDARTHEAFVKYQQSKYIAMAMLVLPALTYMITEVSENPTAYERYEWFMHLKKYYNAFGMDFVEDIIHKDENPVIIAQEMLLNPVSRAYRELQTLEG